MKKYIIKYKEKYLLINKMIIALIIILFNMINSENNLKAQSYNNLTQDVVMPSVDGLNFGKPEDIPISYFVGNADIKIPIRTISSGKLTHNIYLSYNSTGIKVAEPASSVGANWNIHAGGMITRTVLSNEDEDVNGYLYTGLGAATANTQDLLDMSNGLIDEQPDIFTFSCGKIGGKFMFLRTGTYPDMDVKIVTFPLSDLKIGYTIAQSDENTEDVGEYFKQFIITDVDGTKYYFGYDDEGRQAYELTYTKGNTDGQNAHIADYHVNGWKILKIISLDGKDVIKFHYENRQKYSQLMPASLTFKNWNSINCFSSPPCEDPLAFMNQSNYSSSGYFEEEYNCYVFKTSILSDELTKITTENETVEFISSTEREDLGNPDLFYNYRRTALDMIKIKFGNNCSDHEIDYGFEYGYFEGNHIGIGRPENKRLKLNKIKISGTGITNIPPYIFEYYEGEVPNRISKAIDHWGYYNGHHENINHLLNIPFYENLNVGGSNRETNPDVAKNGTLKRITYPLSGTQTLDYESNDFYNTETEIIETWLFGLNVAGCGENNMDSDELFMEENYNSDDMYFNALYDLREAYLNCGDDFEDIVQFKLEAFKASSNEKIGEDIYTLNYQHETYANLKIPLTNLEDNGSFESNENYIISISIGIPDGNGNFNPLPGDAFINFYVEEEQTIGNDPVGGLRISEIRSDDKNGNISSRKFDYYTDGKSNGILIQKPIYIYGYAHMYSFYNGGSSEYTGTQNFLVAQDQSLVPLSETNGYHINYPKVKEILSNNSYTEYEYYTSDLNAYTENGELNNFFPFVPKDFKPQNGMKKYIKSYNISNDLVDERNFFVDSIEDIIYNIGYKHQSGGEYLAGNNSGNTINVVWFNSYKIKSRISRIQSVSEIKDGVLINKSYSYDNNQSIDQPVISEVSDENSKSKITNYYYAKSPEISNFPFINDLISANAVGIPFKTTINNGAGGGNEIYYTKVNESLVPEKYFYINDNGSTKLLEKVLEYDNELHPEKVKIKNQNSESEYIWDNNLIVNKKYANRNWDYHYKPGCKLLDKYTDNADIISTFEYDGLQRLSSSTTNNGRVKNEYTYQYAGSSGGENKITNILSYPGSSTIADLTIENIYDGFGRPTESRKLGYTQDGNDYITEKVYDEMGRVALDCDPGKGGCTSFEYEPSPLNRVIKIHPPGTDKVITKEYGTNTESIGGYAPNTLFLVRTTDENGIVSEQYTDIFGRKIQDVIDAGGLDLKTTYTYNDRDQVTQIIPPNGTPYTYTYFPDGLLKTKVIPDKGLYSYTYNDQDQIDTETLPNGHTLTYSYNSPYNDLLESLTMDDGTVLKSYTYDEVKGWQTGETLALLGESGTISNTVSGFDDIGRVTMETRSYPAGNATNTYKYDGANNMLLKKVQMTGPGNPVNITKSFEYNHGVRLIKTQGEFPTVGHVSINDMHYNDNDWLNQKKINANQPIDYGYTARGWLNKINGLASTYPPDFEPCDSDNPGIDCEGPYTVTDISVLYNCIELGLQQATNVVVIIASTISTNTGSQTDSTTFIVPLNGGTQNMNIQYQNQISASISAGSNPQSTIEGVIQTIIDCLEENDTGGGSSSGGGTDLGSQIMQTQNEYALNNLATMMLDALTGPGSGIGNGSGGDNTSTPPMIPATLFGMKMYYEQGNGDLAAPAQYNGNISWMEWRAAGEIKHQYGFDYDGANRLLYAKYKGINEETCEEMPEGAYDVNINGYDEMGNILGITRKGLTDIVDDVPQYGVIDNMTYSYNAGSNLLQSISEAGNTEHGFKNSTTYSYDGHGNMRGNGDNLSAITYSDYLDLPIKIEAPEGYIEMVYDANGKKLRQRYYKSGGSLEKEYLYQDGVEYKDGRLDAIYHEEGRIVYDGEIPNQLGQETMTYKEFYLKDHLGNTRVRFVDKNGDGLIQVDTTDEKINELTASYHYYPFGMMWEGGHYRKDPNNPPPTQGNFFAPQDVKNKYRYNGKEFIEDFDIGLYDYGARWYDPSIGRFIGVDLLAEKYPGWNPYHYVHNNPVRLVDRDGMEAEDIIVGGVTWTPGAKGEGESDFVQQTFAALNQLVSDPSAGEVSTKERTGHVILDFVGENAIGDVEIIQGPGLNSFHETSEDGKTINFSENVGIFIQAGNSVTGESGAMSPATLLGHEFAHAWLAQASPKLNAGFEKADGNRLNLGKDSPNEHKWVGKVERSFAAAAGETGRKNIRSAASNKANSVNPSGLGPLNDYFFETKSSTSTKPK